METFWRTELTRASSTGCLPTLDMRLRVSINWMGQHVMAIGIAGSNKP